MHRQQQHVVVRRQPRPAGRGSAAPRQVEGRARLVRHQAAQLAPPRPAEARRSCSTSRNRSPRPGRCAATGSPSTAAEGGAQRLVARDDAVQRPRAAPPRSSSPRSRSAHGMWYAAPARLQLLQEPQPLLRERERQRPPRGPRGSIARPPRRARRSRSPRAKSASTGRSKRSRERHLHAQRLPHARDRPAPPAASARPARRSGRAGPPAPRPAAPPRSPPAPPRSRPRRLVRRAARTASPSGRGERLAVHLAVRRQRQRLQPHVRRRHHVLRQALGEVRPQRVAPRPARRPRRTPPAAGRPARPRAPAPPPRARPGAPAAAPRSRPARCGSRGPSPGSPVRPRYSASPSGAAHAAQVTGAVHPRPRRAERVGDEALRRQSRDGSA